METIIKQLSMNTRWYINVLEGITDEEAAKRLNRNVNHLKWIAGHLLLGRYRSISRSGADIEPYPHVDKFIRKDTPPPNAIPIDDSIEYPPLKETLEFWNAVSEKFLSRLPLISEEKLSAELPFTLPINGKTLRDVFAFTASHEAYHIGQMSFIRKSLGHKVMVYM